MPFTHANSEKIRELWNKIDFKSSKAEKQYEKLESYVYGIIDSLDENDDDALFLEQYLSMAQMTQKLHSLKKKTDERIDNLISTTDRISKRLAKLETEMADLRNKMNREGLE